MTMRLAPPITDQPEVELAGWGILLSPDGHAAYLVGSVPGIERGRRSTAVESFDQGTMTAHTESGRQYRLVGEPDWRNGLVIFVSMYRVVPPAGCWITPEQLAEHVNSNRPGMH